RYIPGSHKIGDGYADCLQNALGWPNPVTKAGGMNEHDYFPENISYAAQPPNSDYTFIEPGGADGSNKNMNGKGFALPHAVLKPGPGDVAVFDFSGIHSGTIGLPSQVRIQTVGVFCVNPFDESFDFEGYGIKASRMELAKDLLLHLAM